MNKFEKKFNLFLEESEMDQIAPADVNPETDGENFENAFEDPATAQDFQADPNIAGFTQKYIDEGKEWVAKLIEVADWLSGMDDGSLTQRLSKIDVEGSAFDGISNENKKISSVSEDVLGISETLKRYILEASRRQGQAQGQGVQQEPEIDPMMQ